MKEDFLHYIWQHQYFAKAGLATADDEMLQVLRVGYYNTDAGPDFREAILRVGEVEWSGSVEIHVRASEWYRHQHQQDPRYDQVVLHVVWEADKPVQRTDGTLVPVLELKERVDLQLLKTYERLQQAKNAIPCAAFWPDVPEITKTLMLERALVERLETKGEEVLKTFQRYEHDWEQTAYHTLLRGFGFKINQQAFGELANALPLSVVRRHQASLLQLEALLLGQAGFLEEAPDEYARQLQKEYLFLSHKYQLQTRKMERYQWNFLRLRPANFPTVRLAQVAAVLYQQQGFFSMLLEAKTVKAYEAFFQAQASPYWQQHYLLGKEKKALLQRMGKGSAHNLIINVTVPLLTAYAAYTDNRQHLEKAVNLLEQLKEESNKITRLYEELGWQAKSAADNQAALGLYKNYCQPVNCMRCAIGNKVMKQNSFTA
ncbi:uncharacterized protein DUF2851 [Pontibacter ummariensis]|uniref:DUF2851 domain-containing protein n=1 Tax=Pontibacter ummariensis TaxID=1610492 RepID=A0A239EH02_9BACT|nr:DUF2851 family protein [Pontibacter ummariensis]PRY13247.1 uncharacterized protein DUF2851 [Pontibacter ummariensis]SNS43711.1 Protein of unknown function [Pontibacter ummariensis]